VRRWNTEVNRIMQLPEVQRRMELEGERYAPNTLEQFAQFIRAETAKWEKVLKDAGGSGRGSRAATRFDSAFSNLQTTAENLSASRARLKDADYAAETAALSCAQILQKAAVAMHVQAKALPNNVLALLRVKQAGLGRGSHRPGPDGASLPSAK